jgi:hypothetical protein
MLAAEKVRQIARRANRLETSQTLRSVAFNEQLAASRLLFLAEFLETRIAA